MYKPNTRILILDDMFTMRKIVIKNLKEFGFTDIQEAADGNIGWEILKSSNPPIELIISDWNMPNCTGLELLKRVRTEEKYSKVPFILLTAEAEAHQVMEAMKQGVSNYIVKPFTTEAMREKIKQTYKKTSGAA